MQLKNHKRNFSNYCFPFAIEPKKAQTLYLLYLFHMIFNFLKFNNLLKSWIWSIGAGIILFGLVYFQSIPRLYNMHTNFFDVYNSTFAGNLLLTLSMLILAAYLCLLNLFMTIHCLNKKKKKVYKSYFAHKILFINISKQILNLIQKIIHILQKKSIS